MKQHTMLCSSCLQHNIPGTNMTSLVISHKYPCHHNFTKFVTNDIFVDVSIYETIDHDLCHHCFALPCECVQIDIMMTAKKG